MKLRITLVAAALATLAWAGGGWKSKPFPDWSDSVVRRALTNSPWTHQRSVQLEWHKREDKPITPRDVPGADPNSERGARMGSPVGGIGVANKRNSLPLMADLLVRWASALPIRHAKALYRQRSEHLPVSKLNGLIEQPSDDYVVEIFGLPSEMAHLGAGMLEQAAREGVRLKAGRREWAARQARVVLNGDTLSVFVHFPRGEDLSPEVREISVIADLQVVKFTEDFKLTEMKYQGRLDL